MTPEQIFPVVNLIALGGWMLLALLPRQPALVDRIAGAAVPAVLASIYAALVATSWFNSRGGFSSLDAVAALFENRWLLLAGWTHYLAFDLLVGSWEARDARERGVPHLLLLPCLALTFLFGPIGWLLYLGCRRVAVAHDAVP